MINVVEKPGVKEKQKLVLRTLIKTELTYAVEIGACSIFYFLMTLMFLKKRTKTDNAVVTSQLESTKQV